jgi:hypothetical protein
MKLLLYLWALPNTLFGLLFVPLAVFTKGGMFVVGGVLELHSRAHLIYSQTLLSGTGRR